MACGYSKERVNESKFSPFIRSISKGDSEGYGELGGLGPQSPFLLSLHFLDLAMPLIVSSFADP